MTSFWRTLRFVTFAGAVIAAESVSAEPAWRSDPAMARHSSYTVIGEGRPTLGPMAYVKFCMTYRTDCEISHNADRVALTNTRWTELHDVNQSVNRGIKPRKDPRHEAPWSLEAKAGDCNLFAIQKRHALLARGWPSSDLSLAVVVTRSGVGHLVLVVRTDHGDLVMDNLKTSVLPWTANDYTWLKIQAISNPDHWVEVERQRGVPPNYQIFANLDRGSD